MDNIENKVIIGTIFRIGEFSFNSSLGTLTRDSKIVKLEPQTADFLLVLLTNKGTIVSRDQLLSTVWDNRQVSDDAIRAVVKKLRTAFVDDARNPQYIKTLPLKGYMLIAPTKEDVSSASLIRKRHIIKVALFVLVLGLIWMYQFQKSSQDSKPNTVVAFITKMAGSELSPDYNSATQMLVFSHRASNENPMHLFVKNLSTNKVQRLTWDTANYANALWSPSGKSLIYTRSSPLGVSHYIAEFDPINGLMSNRRLEDQSLKGKFIVGWSSNNNTIYLKDGYQRKTTQGISSYNFKSKELISITAPTVAGVGDFFAKESYNGKLLAILRGVDANKHELLVLDIGTGSLVLNRVLPFNTNRLVWAEDNQSIILSGFKGELFKYDIALDEFKIIPLNAEHINDILYNCGLNCFFMRQHNGNYLDIQERPNPFGEHSLLATDYLQLSSADDLPVYSENGDALYFISLTSDNLFLHRQRNNSGLEVLAQFPKDVLISSMQVNNKQSFITGVIGKRVFVFNVSKGTHKFITTDFEKVSNPVWNLDGSAILFSKIEKGQLKIYRHELMTNKQEIVSSGFQALRQLTPTTYFAIDGDMKAWYLEKDKEPHLLATVQSANPNRWQIIRGNLYFTTRSGEEAMLHKVSLSDENSDQKVFGKNQFRLNFSLHEQLKKIAIVISLLAESNIVMVQVDNQ